MINNKNKIFKWKNTNALLKNPHYQGLKTGITEAAGPCLSAFYKNKDT